MQVEGGELQSALQYQVLSTGLQHGHLLVVVGGVQHQQWSMLPLEEPVSCTHHNYTHKANNGEAHLKLLHQQVYICMCDYNTFESLV